MSSPRPRRRSFDVGGYIDTLSPPRFARKISPDVRIQALVHSGSFRILACSSWNHTIAELSGIDTHLWFNSNRGRRCANYKGIDTTRCWLYVWDPQHERLKLSVDQMDRATIDECVLRCEKAGAIDRVLQQIFFLRRPFWNELPLQDLISVRTHDEARRVLELGLTDDDGQFPFVSAYARARSMDLVQAAKDLSIRHQIVLHRLADTENVRVRTCDRIKLAQSVEEVERSLADFQKETIAYSKI